MAMRIALGAVTAGAIAIALAWGWGALGVYLFFVFVAGALTFGLTAGAGWLTGASRGRFHDGKRG